MDNFHTTYSRGTPFASFEEDAQGLAKPYPWLLTTHLSEILDGSQKQPVIIFKYSSDCGTSAELKLKLEKAVTEKKLDSPIYIVVVQDHPVLSKKIAEMFDITHESPQIIILNKGKVTYTAHHRDIKIENFVFA